MKLTFNWIKKGVIYNPEGNHFWNKTHAQVPVVDVLSDRLRIYYAARNEEGKSNTSFIETDKNDPQKILYIHDKPLLEFGDTGMFDESGIMPASIKTVGSKKYLYYIGWSLKSTVPYQNSIGLAISDDGVNFKKLSPGPILAQSIHDPCFTGTMDILEDNGIYRGYYLSCFKWIQKKGKAEPVYHIKYAESDDGINWKRKGKVAVELQKGEGGIASATVVKIDAHYHMWFSYRKAEDYRGNKSNTYRIGYSYSIDGKNWQRKDSENGIDVSPDGWDAEMTAYPYIIKLNNQLLMFYNGNGFGKSGFGYATTKINDND